MKLSIYSPHWKNYKHKSWSLKLFECKSYNLRCVFKRNKCYFKNRSLLIEAVSSSSVCLQVSKTKLRALLLNTTKVGVSTWVYECIFYNMHLRLNLLNWLKFSSTLFLQARLVLDLNRPPVLTTTGLTSTDSRWPTTTRAQRRHNKPLASRWEPCFTGQIYQDEAVVSSVFYIFT